PAPEDSNPAEGGSVTVGPEVPAEETQVAAPDSPHIVFEEPRVSPAIEVTGPGEAPVARLETVVPPTPTGVDVNLTANEFRSVFQGNPAGLSFAGAEAQDTNAATP